MITISNASDALKTIYLGVIAEQLNTKINPFLAAIERTSNNVFGKEVKKLVTYGVNGGITSGTETGALPKAQGNSYVTLTTDLKNFFGKIEISDKALRASMDDSGAFVNLLNAEMEGLLSASKRNFARMLFGDGSGKLATTVVYAENEDLAKFKVDDASKIEAGMVIDIETNGAITSATKNKVVKSVDHTNNVVTLTSNLPSVQGKDSIVYVQGSRSNELTGLESIFGTSSTLYGLARADYDFLTPYKDATGGTMSAALIQDAIDHVEERSGGIVNFIVTSYAVRKKYVAYCASSNHNVDVMNLDCGYKALSYSGIPFVVDRFCGKKDMYLLNTDDFKLHQLCDWRWIEDAAGGILKQESGSAAYSATLVKYADLMCERPVGQAKITNITVD